MIRINLLESERASAGKGKGSAGAGSKPSGGGGGGVGPYIPLLATLVVALVGCGILFTTLTSEIETTKTKITAAKAEIEKLKVEKARKDELEQKRKSFTDQVNLIERLKAEQGGPVHMLDEISKALPDFVWLTSITQAGASLKIAGEASTNNAIADFLNNLQRAGDGCDLASVDGRTKCWFPEANLDSYEESLVGSQAIVTFRFTTVFRNPAVAQKDAAAAAVAAQKKAPAAPAAPAKK